MSRVRFGPSRSIGTPSSGPSTAPGNDNTTKSSARSLAPASNLNDAKPQIATIAIQLPVALTTSPPSSSGKPRVRNTFMLAQSSAGFPVAWSSFRLRRARTPSEVC